MMNSRKFGCFCISAKKGKLDISGKGVIPYEKIVLIDSLNSKPENGIFF